MKTSQIATSVPPFLPHPLWRGGHLQTLATLRSGRSPVLRPIPHLVPTRDDDTIVLHEDLPTLPDDEPRGEFAGSTPSVLLVHGLCGCHRSSYMVRIADRLTRRGIRVFRMDQRVCGAATKLSNQITHAGRSDDCADALDYIAARTDGPLGVAGFSMGGNQVLRMLGHRSVHPSSDNDFFDRLIAAFVVAPPVDLACCSRHMLTGLRRVYSRYFLKRLLRGLPHVARRHQWVDDLLATAPPKTLWDFDDRLTAPLAGFKDAMHYYDTCSARRVTGSIRTPTCLVAAINDPIVPITCFRGDQAAEFSTSVQRVLVPGGGHLGFVDRRGNCWIDGVAETYFSTQFGVGSISSATGEP